MPIRPPQVRESGETINRIKVFRGFIDNHPVDYQKFIFKGYPCRASGTWPIAHHKENCHD